MQWVPEVRKYMKKVPLLLVGTQIELREDPTTLQQLQKNRQEPITREEGEKVAKELKLHQYLECSAITQVYICSGQNEDKIFSPYMFLLIVWLIGGYQELSHGPPSSNQRAWCHPYIRRTPSALITTDNYIEGSSISKERG